MNTSDPLDGPEQGQRARPFNPNPEAVATRESSMLDVAMSRAAQEVQAAMVIAKKMPRDEDKAFTRIMNACKRKTLAEDAMYAYPRGGATVSGPSIRLAEVLAQNWGNIDSGVVELDQREGESTVMAYAWDLETNTKSTKIFTVKHIREKRGGNTTLTDPRDIYEMTANQGARRLRACILAIIPGDVVDAAIKACDKTLEQGGVGPIIDRLRAMLVEFEPLGVSKEMIEKRLGHKLDTTTETELANMRKIFKSIRDNFASKESYFDIGPAGAGEAQRPQADAGPKGRATKKAEPQVGGEPGKAFDATKPTDEIIRFCQESDVTQLQVFEWAKKQKLVAAGVVDLPQMAEAKLVNILTNWNAIVAEIKKH